jgi:uncharacterized protein with HEPN domain
MPHKDDAARDLVRLKHMLENSLRARHFVVHLTFEQFRTDTVVQYATVRAIELIGEASRHITESTKSQFTEIEWRGMREMRNHIIHGYDHVDIEKVWDTIHHDLPKLIGQLRAAM